MLNVIITGQVSVHDIIKRKHNGDAKKDFFLFEQSKMTSS